MSEVARIDLTARPNPLEVVEAHMLQLLAAGLGNHVRIEAMPAMPSAWDLGSSDAAVLVHYLQSRFGEAGEGGRVQRRTAVFNVVVVVRSLRGKAGAYELLHQVRLALQGRPVGGGSAMTLVSEMLTSESEGIWQWELQVATTLPTVGAPSLSQRSAGPASFTKEVA